ncbi:hypothetical protein F4777DRAFT_385053 [Nemania sp. FL0916]|nr:hypothetical protein F4777DRAFT_385053 [Nemania sp. FL0916]
MGIFIHISTEGTVYFAERRHGDDDDMLQLYSRVLLGVTIDSTFDAVYSRVSSKWHLQDDIFYPFHDRRRSLIQTVWVFDLDLDILRFDKEDCHRQLPLSVIRSRAATLADFHPYAPPRLPEPGSQTSISPPYRKLRRRGLDAERIERRRAFVGRILADFAFQWRHILCSRYNDSTFRKFASAIIKIATLDFNVVEVTTSRHGIGGFIIWLHNLPGWDAFKERVIPISGTSTSVVMSRHIPHAIAMIRDHFAKTWNSGPDGCWEYRSYLILTVREVILYQINSDSPEIYTEPKRLFNGYDPPCQEAIQLLLEATYSGCDTTLIHQSPVELQDLILDNVSMGPIERARVGCILECGSRFAWRDKNRDIKREEVFRNREPWTPVESHIWFGDRSSGLAYK